MKFNHLIFGLILFRAYVGFSAELIFELTFKDGIVTPQQLKVPADKKFKIVVKNQGKTAEEFESLELNREKIVAPGKQITLFLGPLKKDTYTFMGEFHKDQASANGKIIAE